MHDHLIERKQSERQKAVIGVALVVNIFVHFSKTTHNWNTIFPVIVRAVKGLEPSSYQVYTWNDSTKIEIDDCFWKIKKEGFSISVLCDNAILNV